MNRHPLVNPPSLEWRSISNDCYKCGARHETQVSIAWLGHFVYQCYRCRARNIISIVQAPPKPTDGLCPEDTGAGG